MWELDHKEGWVPKNWCFWTVVLEKTLESPLDTKEIKSVNPKGNQLWVFIGRTDAEVEAPVLWPPDVKGWIIRKDPDAGKDWQQQEKRVTEDEMVEWHHWFYGCEFEQTLGDSERQGSLVSCSPWGDKESDMIEWRTTAKEKAMNTGRVVLGQAWGSEKPSWRKWYPNWVMRSENDRSE